MAVCSQKKALIIATSVFACLFAFSVLIAFISQTGEKLPKYINVRKWFTLSANEQIVLVWADRMTTILTSMKTPCPGNQRRPTESHTLGTACDCQISCDPYAIISPYIPISPLTSWKVYTRAGINYSTRVWAYEDCKLLKVKSASSSLSIRKQSFWCSTAKTSPSLTK